ncbi:MAG TPA: DUF6519 domain-containing protein [Pyrinomonadaceae bacterium]|jgi:hypothetical protein
MAGDYTRFTFNPLEDHAGVFMQQGRVLLDADFNELVELIDRRLRAETIDIIGRCVVPKETPDGFKIGISGGTLTIGRGRLYADGLLAENHGRAPLEFDPVLGEVRGTLGLTYQEQPYYVRAPRLPALPAGGPHLVYADVWEREVTALEEPDLIEKAVGVDTATRRQTVWQVKVHQNSTGGAISCSTPDASIPGWLDVIKPSAARLTTAAVGAPASDDPCILPPAGGYRGTDNRLYRVEIHDGGQQTGAAGGATFKWSVDNASVATNVTAFNPALTQLTVVRTGRDPVLRFKKDDWVEVKDDWLEFEGKPGVMRKVASVDDVAHTITLTAALPNNVFDNANPGSRHARVIRWDQKGANVDANGGLLLVPVAGTNVPLGDGVQITFTSDPAGGRYRVADYWAFAARVADASVEILDHAPPRGIHHHYCRLAVVTFPNNVTDCRTLWPPEFGGAGCDCTVCVTPEGHNGGTLTIQMAIDRVKDKGGKVCLEPGKYRLDDPVRFDGAKSVHVRGHGWKTQLLYRGPGSAIEVRNSLQVTLENFTLQTALREVTADAVRAMGPAVNIVNSFYVTVERCNILHFASLLAAQAQAQGTLGDSTFGVPNAIFVDRKFPRFFDQPAIGVSGFLLMTEIRSNLLLGGSGIESLATTVGERGRTGANRLREELTRPDDTRRSDAPFIVSYDFVAERNMMVCLNRGVSLNGTFAFYAGELRLAENSIYGCIEAGVFAQGRVLTDAGDLVTLASRLDVKSNLVQVIGHGIVVATDDTRVCDNDVGTINLGPFGRFFRRTPSVGIGLLSWPEVETLRRCHVIGNRVREVAGDGIYMGGSVTSVMIKQNYIAGVKGSGIITAEEGFCEALSIENNQLEDIASDETNAGDPLIGIGIMSARSVAVVGNRINRVGASAIQNPLRAGIAIAACDCVRVAGNEVLLVGPSGQQFIGDAVGIDISSPFTRVDVVDNIVRRMPFVFASPSVGPPANYAALRIREFQPGGGAFPNATFVVGANAVIVFSSLTIATLPRGQEIISARGNLLDAHAVGVPLVRLGTNGVVVFNDNRCSVAGIGDAAGTVFFAPTVTINAGSVIASNNYVEGDVEKNAAMQIDVPVIVGTSATPATVLGNIVSRGGIRVNGSPLPAPWAPLNIKL